MTANEFNEKYKQGSKFSYQSIIGKSKPIETITKSAAWDCCGSVIVKVDVRAGGVDIEHLKEIKEGSL